MSQWAISSEVNMRKITNQEFIDKVKEIYDNEYLFLEEYKTLNQPILCKHNIETCGHQWYIRPSNLIGKTKNTCPRCKKNAPITIDEFKNYVYEIEGDNYKVLSSEIVRMLDKIKFKHSVPECGIEYDASPTKFKMGRRCPVCAQTRFSYAAKHIKSILDDKLIKYELEKKFSDCINSLPLPFDFYFEINDIKICIEYDGRQHFSPVDLFGGDEGFKRTHANDIIKTNYCKDNGIHLLRINYLHKNSEFEKIITDFILERSTTIPVAGVGSSDPK